MWKTLFGSDKPSPLVESAYRDISTMLHQSRHMLDLALTTLLDNVTLEEDLDRLDDAVDVGERMVRRTILEHLSINPSVDLVASLLLLSTVQDAERIGDFARGLVEVSEMAKSPRTGEFAADLRAMADRLRPMFDDAEVAFREDDSKRAARVIAAHGELRQDLKAYRARAAASDLTADMAMVYASSAQILRRVGAHLSNIASTVVQPFDRIRHGDEDS